MSYFSCSAHAESCSELHNSRLRAETDNLSYERRTVGTRLLVHSDGGIWSNKNFPNGIISK